MQISIEGVDGVINALQNLVSSGKLQNGARGCARLNALKQLYERVYGTDVIE